jgi:pimeloyl-ACP methyl ester carboxylesterase
VNAPANPLRGVQADSAYLSSVLATIAGPIVLVGHSYGGFVITDAATGNPNVKALVYIAAFAPDNGETPAQILAMNPAAKPRPPTSRSGPTPAAWTPTSRRAPSTKSSVPTSHPQSPR